MHQSDRGLMVRNRNAAGRARDRVRLGPELNTENFNEIV
jgi:hypothetical protein